MSYIISLDFQQPEPYYLRVNSDGSSDECYDPTVATPFSSKKEALTWGKENTTFGKYVKVVDYNKAFDKFDKWIVNGMVRRHFEPINRKLSRQYDPTKDDKYAVLKWHCEYAVSGSDIRYEDYKTWPPLYRVFHCLFSVERYEDRNNEMTTFQLSVRKDVSFEQFQEELSLVLDKVSYVDCGNLVFPIIDYKCGEGGDFVYLVKKCDDDLWGVKGRYDLSVEMTSLRECFNYIKERRYFS